jgi:hypothetical protein
MPQPPGDGPQIDASSEQFRRRVVAKCVNMRPDAYPDTCSRLRVASTACGDQATSDHRTCTAHQQTRCLDPRRGRQPAPSAHAAGRRSRSRAQCGASGGSWCPSRRRHPDAAHSCGESRSSHHRGRCRAAQSADLAAADASRRDEPHERAPVLVHRERRRQQPCRLGRRRRGGLRRPDPRALCDASRVRRDPVPADGSRERATDDRVDLTHRRSSHRPAHVQSAARRHAVVLAEHTVSLDERPTVTPRPAAAQLGVQRLNAARTQFRDADRGEHGLDHPLDVPDVASASRLLDLNCPQPLVQRSAQRHGSLRDALLVHLSLQPGEGSIGPLPSRAIGPLTDSVR